MCNSENFPFFDIDNTDLLENCFNSNFSCKCLTSKNLTLNPEKDMKLLNLKELNFQKDTHFSQFDPDEHIVDPTEFKYYTTHEFHKLKTNISRRGTNLSLFHSNICSLNGNKEKLQDFINNLDYQFDVIALTETWHTRNNIYFNSGQIEGYHKYEGIEGSSNKGGCGFFIKDSIAYTIRNDLNIKFQNKNSEFETNWVELIGLGNEKLVVGVVYRHPKSKDIDFIKYLSNSLNILRKEKKKVIICGDFNYNLLAFDKNKETNDFLNLMISNWFTPQILGPTRITGHQKESLIDNIFINFSDLHCSSGNLFEKISDHLPNFMIIENLSALKKEKSKVRIRDMKNFNENNFINELKNLKLEEVLKTIPDLNMKYEYFHDKILYLINKNAPMRDATKKENKRNHKPWITSGILKSIKQKNKLLKKFLKTKDNFYYCRYKFYRDKINHLIRSEKRKYYDKFFKDNLDNSKKIWQQVNKIINRKKNKDEIIGIRKGNVIETDPIKIGNVFNEYYTTIAKKLTKNIRETTSFDSFLDERQENSMFLTPTDTKEVIELINDLSVNKAKDIYGISVNFLKILANDIAPSLCHIFNESFFTGIFPDLMKLAMITPTYKGGSRLEASNYRPVSVLPIFSKILEKLMQKRLTNGKIKL